MRIGETATSFVPLAQRLEKAGELQSVFSAVLESVGREGYQSAETILPDQTLDQPMQTAWDNTLTGSSRKACCKAWTVSRAKWTQ